LISCLGHTHSGVERRDTPPSCPVTFHRARSARDSNAVTQSTALTVCPDEYGVMYRPREDGGHPGPSLTPSIGLIDHSSPTMQRRTRRLENHSATLQTQGPACFLGPTDTRWHVYPHDRAHQLSSPFSLSHTLGFGHVWSSPVILETSPFIASHLLDAVDPILLSLRQTSHPVSPLDRVGKEKNHQVALVKLHHVVLHTRGK
jgi:hypothetical protein